MGVYRAQDSFRCVIIYVSYNQCVVDMVLVGNDLISGHM